MLNIKLVQLRYPRFDNLIIIIQKKTQIWINNINISLNI